MLKSNKLPYIVLLLLIGRLNAQPMPEHLDPLLFPIKPGITNTLAGTMGELRSSHFHTGIDIRTGGQEGLNVLAADDGYIFRISVNPVGYGNTIYIKHPNGHTTVYGHLKSFNKEIADYVRAQQYKKKKFNLNMFPEAALFRVKRGDTIALSGNSGSSGGPHLHFDVRNRNQDLLNPLHYGFTEITDHKPPIANELALVTSTIESRVMGEYGRIEIPFKSENNTYYINDTIEAIGNIGMELFAYDRMDNTRFRTGINQIEVKINNTIQFITTIETWPFSKARQFYTYINYEALVNSGKRFHKLYIDGGNHLNFYSNTTNNGNLLIEEGKVYNVDISITDSYENKSVAHFILKGSKTETGNTPFNTSIPKSNWKIEKNTLVIKTSIGDTLQVYAKDKKLALTPAYLKNQEAIYLWDLKKEIIDSISINGATQSLFIKSFIPAEIEYKLYDPIADIQFSENTLFSDLFLTLSNTTDSLGIETIMIGDSSIPLNKNYTVYFKPANLQLNKKYDRIYAVWGKNKSFVGGNWLGDKISFITRNFGSYSILADSIPPITKPLILNKDEMVFNITDELSGINTYNMYVNEEWVLMNYDPKRNLIWAEKPNSEYSYTGEIKLRVTDNTGNETLYSTTLN